MQSVNSILAELYKSREIIAQVKRLPDYPDREDIRQEAFIELFGKPKEFITGLHERKELTRYACRLIINLHKWAKSKQVGKVVLVENVPDMADEPPQDRPTICLAGVNWYHAGLLELYATHGSYAKAAQVSGIPAMTIFDGVKKAKQQLKKAI